VTAKRSDLADLPDWPRLLSREQAAAYCGVSGARLDRLLPGLPAVPAEIGRVLFDRRLIDKRLDALSGLDVTNGEADDFLGSINWDASP
jgi:hypothetical protein